MKPEHVTSPTTFPVSAKASGIIVSASMVRIAPGGEGLDDGDGGRGRTALQSVAWTPTAPPAEQQRRPTDEPTTRPRA
ncbi:MAG: hypothetical protein ACRDRH_06760 [Pseudonocardia sp.]